MKKLFFVLLSFAQFAVFADPGFYPEDASESQIPRNKIPSQDNLLFTYQEYNAANMILRAIVTSKLMVEDSTDSAKEMVEDSTDSAKENLEKTLNSAKANLEKILNSPKENLEKTLNSAKENLKETLKILGFKNRSLDQLVEQLGQITPDNLRNFSTHLEKSDLRGFYSEKETSPENIPGENIKNKVLYSFQEYNAANYLLKVLSDASKKVNLYFNINDFTNILKKLTIASENDAIDQLVIQLIGTDEQFRLAADESQIDDKSQLIETLCRKIKDASGKNISRDRAFLLLQFLGIDVPETLSDIIPRMGQDLSDYRTIQGNALRDFQTYTRHTINGDANTLNGIFSVCRINGAATGMNAKYTNCIIDGEARSFKGIFSVCIINRAATGKNAEYTDCTIDGGTRSLNGIFSRCTINGAATGSNGKYINCIINGGANTLNGIFSRCTINGAATGNNARYMNCTIDGGANTLNGIFSHCTINGAATRNNARYMNCTIDGDAIGTYAEYAN